MRRLWLIVKRCGVSITTLQITEKNEETTNKLMPMLKDAVNKIFFFILSIMLFMPSVHASEHVTSLTLRADESLAHPLMILARMYSAHHRLRIALLYDRADRNIHAIKEGYAGDIVITANMDMLAELRALGLLDIYSSRRIGVSPLVWVRSADSATTPSVSTGTLFHEKFLSADTKAKIHILNPQFHVDGRAILKFLENKHVKDALFSHMVTHNEHRELTPAFRGKHAYGLMLKADAMIIPNVQVVEAIPPSVKFEAVAVAGTRMEEARQFIDYLTTREAKSVLSAHGFVP